MSRPSLFMSGLFAWLVAEFVAFLMVAEAIGLGGALILGCLTSVAGFGLLRQCGEGAMAHLRNEWLDASKPPGDLLDGVIRTLAALLLILPGFLSDLVGLALAAPSVRTFIARRFRGGGAFGAVQRRAPPGVVDLAPGDWVSFDATGETVK